MSKVVLVILDGLGYDAAVQELGFMEGAVQAGQASRWKVKTALPSNSRPLYETLHTGLTPHEHGVLTNAVVRLSHCKNIFSECRAADKSTGAAAYSWLSELYNGVPYDIVDDRETNDLNKAIQFGRFYSNDDFPDMELFAQAELLIRQHEPDYMLVHPMGCDRKGHLYGGTSNEYYDQACEDDDLLATYVPGWLDRGYDVFVTADHGMDARGQHGGTLDIMQHVALYHMGKSPIQHEVEIIDQRAIAPTILKQLGLEIPPAMKVTPLGGNQ